jgi:FkbM family methyltransferase
MTRTIDLLAWIGSRMGKPPGWERVVRAIASPESCRAMPDVCVIRDGTIFTVKPGIPLGWHVIMFGSYEPELREVLRAVLRKGGVAVDGGANTGWHTMLMAILVGDEGRVLAIEPNPSVRQRLDEHRELNRLRQVEVLTCALSNAEGRVAFDAPSVDDAASGDGHIVGNSQPASPRLVEADARTLDAIVETRALTKVDLVKLDLEGSEWPALRGGERTIARFRPHVIFEYVEEYAGRGGGTPEVLREYFQRHGYRLFELGRHEAGEIDARRWPSAANIWAVPLPIGARGSTS